MDTAPSAPEPPRLPPLVVGGLGSPPCARGGWYDASPVCRCAHAQPVIRPSANRRAAAASRRSALKPAATAPDHLARLCQGASWRDTSHHGGRDMGTCAWSWVSPQGKDHLHSGPLRWWCRSDEPRLSVRGLPGATLNPSTPKGGKTERAPVGAANCASNERAR